MPEPVLRCAAFGHVMKSLHSAICSTSLTRAISLCGLFALTLAATAPASAQTADPQTRYSVTSSKAASNLLLDIAHAGERLVAVGDRGHILFSDDQGKSWSQAKVPTLQMLTAIHFIDDQHGWAVGHDALILTTSDGGETWKTQYEEREREAPLLDLWFGDAQHGIAVGAYGAILETTDGGQSWDDISDRLDNEDGYHLNAISAVSGGELFIVGEMGSVFRSTDNGQTWELVESPYEGSFFGVLGGSELGVVLVYGLRGHLFRSEDSGANWQQVQLADDGRPLRSGLAGGALLDDGDIAIVGHGGAVLTSTDQGRSFNVIHRGDRRSLASVTGNTQGELLLVGQGGVQIAGPTGEEPSQQQ